MSKALLLVCAVMLSAISVGAQCRQVTVGKPLRVRLVMEKGVPIFIESAFLNNLRSIPDIVVNASSTGGQEDIVVHVMGIELKNVSDNVIGNAWSYDVYRNRVCDGMVLEEDFYVSAISSGPSNVGTEASVLEDVADINVKAFEKLRQERDVPKH